MFTLKARFVAVLLLILFAIGPHRAAFAAEDCTTVGNNAYVRIVCLQKRIDALSAQLSLLAKTTDARLADLSRSVDMRFRNVGNETGKLTGSLPRLYRLSQGGSQCVKLRKNGAASPCR